MANALLFFCRDFLYSRLIPVRIIEEKEFDIAYDYKAKIQVTKVPFLLWYTLKLNTEYDGTKFQHHKISRHFLKSSALEALEEWKSFLQNSK